MPGGLVLHDAQLERQRNEVAMANTRAQMARSGMHSSMPPPDPNSHFMRKIKAATVERTIQAVEAQERADRGESVHAYDRKKDYYALLGIDKEASAAEVRRAFRRLSLKYHPDKVAYKSDEEKAEAADLFAALKEAHEVLRHEATRREYDQVMGVDDLLADKDFDLADIEAALAKVRNGLGKRRPAPTYYEVDVTLEELYTGCTKEVTHVRVVGAAATRKEIQLVRRRRVTWPRARAPRVRLACAARAPPLDRPMRRRARQPHRSLAPQLRASRRLRCRAAPSEGPSSCSVTWRRSPQAARWLAT